MATQFTFLFLGHWRGAPVSGVFQKVSGGRGFRGVPIVFQGRYGRFQEISGVYLNFNGVSEDFRGVPTSGSLKGITGIFKSVP